jgi:tRNA threonylcarbamoyladenosine biosynthesis protein TsaB
VKILALDTATENCSVALLIDGRLIALEERLERGHAERILPMLDELLSRERITPAALNAIAFGRGPGAFTGVRLAASVTQGLAFGAGVAVVPVSDLRGVAQRALDAQPALARVLVCNDARMHEVYWGCFERSSDGLAVAVAPEQAASPSRVVLPPAWTGAVHGAGSGFGAYPELRQRLEGRLALCSEGLLPRAQEIARLAVPEVAAGRVLPAEQALPVYLRDDVARTAGDAVIKLTPA